MSLLLYFSLAQRDQDVFACGALQNNNGTAVMWEK